MGGEKRRIFLDCRRNTENFNEYYKIKSLIMRMNTMEDDGLPSTEGARTVRSETLRFHRLVMDYRGGTDLWRDPYGRRRSQNLSGKRTEDERA